MTVSYSGKLAQLLLRWRGSLWKTIYLDLLVFLVLYYSVSFVYRFYLVPGYGSPGALSLFEKAAITCNEYAKNFPLQFLLAFYVLFVTKRWWQQLANISWASQNLAHWLSACVRGKDEETCRTRARIIRYATLAATLAMRVVSTRVLKRFPTMDQLEEAGLLSRSERHLLERVKVSGAAGPWFVPLNWCLTILSDLYSEEKRLRDRADQHQLVRELETYRNKIEQLLLYDWIPPPLIYTQLTTVCTYAYFALCLMGSQYLQTESGSKGQGIDMYFPFFTVLQFLFYIGWLKVADSLLNPFSDDDDGFEVDFVLDRFFERSLLICQLHGQVPSVDGSFPDLATTSRAATANHDHRAMRNNFQRLSLGRIEDTAPKSKTPDTRGLVPNGAATSTIDQFRFNATENSSSTTKPQKHTSPNSSKWAGFRMKLGRNPRAVQDSSLSVYQQHTDKL